MSDRPVWILHVSDPHLGDVSRGLDDEKERIEYQRDLETTQTVFKRTLLTLEPFVAEHGPPAATVVSGDLTYRARTSGFDAFGALLRDAKHVLPTKRSDIVVVPGNHDVIWDEPPGESKRYARFLRATRKRGCATPLLDGVDFDAETGSLHTTGARHVVIGDGFEIIPVNSSNYCGALTTVRGGWDAAAWEKALEPLTVKAKKDARAELKRLRQQDMARISRAQITALGRYLDRENIERTPRPGVTRIAVLHHQLLPISTREERKAFESLVNLGLVRQTLAELGFHLVLHGHKHESGLYWDFVPLAGEALATPPRRMLVIAAPGKFDVGDPTMRALFLEGKPHAPNLRVVTFNGAGAQRRRPHVASVERAPLWLGEMETESGKRVAIRAPDAHTAYERVAALFTLDDAPRERHNLVVQVDDPAAADGLPPAYPERGLEDPQRWFTDLVDWWQRDRSELVAREILRFNHGERIRRRWGDQVDRAIRILDKRGGSSRALIALISPRETGWYKADDRPLGKGSYPAFALAELTLTERDGKRQLDCFGYFRKQEMQYWWPVNLAEMKRLQDRVRLGLERKADPGRLVTFAAIALWKSQLPRVAVPTLDRLIDDPERIWGMALAVAEPDAASADAASDWRVVLADLEGEGREALPQPEAGIELLWQELERVRAVGDSARLRAVARAASELRDQYAALSGSKLNPTGRKLVTDRVVKLRKAVKAAGVPL